jgi:hypothetical protein
MNETDVVVPVLTMFGLLRRASAQRRDLGQALLSLRLARGQSLTCTQMTVATTARLKTSPAEGAGNNAYLPLRRSTWLPDLLSLPRPTKCFGFIPILTSTVPALEIRVTISSR